MAAMADSKTNHGGHDSRAIANCFVRLAHDAADRLTIMSLVKYVYFAHGWTLGHTGEPLICHDVQAWKYGPVIPEAYYAFRGKGFIVRGQATDSDGRLYTASPSERQSNIIRDVYRAYSELEPFQLSAATHHPHSPWSKYRGRHYHVIPNDEIKAYYQSIIRKAEGGRA